MSSLLLDVFEFEEMAGVLPFIHKVEGNKALCTNGFINKTLRPILAQEVSTS
jgi:hypothetical protein